VTLERLLAGVLAVVAGQLVRAGELPGTALPRAFVRLLSRVSPFVSLEVRALGVDLVTAGEVAPVDLPLVVAVDRVGRAGGQPGAGHQAAPDTVLTWLLQQLGLEAPRVTVQGLMLLKDHRSLLELF